MSTNSALPQRNASQMDFVILILRVACALPVLYHGCAILFGAFGGPGPVGFASFMHYPVAVGYLVGLAQFAGGLAILSGAFLRVGAFCVIVVMLGAIFIVDVPHGFDINQGGMEYALTELLVAVALLLSGAGAYSLGRSLYSALQKL